MAARRIEPAASPAAGSFAIRVSAAITEGAGFAIRHHFTCSVEFDAEENKPGWQDAMKAALVRMCLARWDS